MQGCSSGKLDENKTIWNDRPSPQLVCKARHRRRALPFGRPWYPLNQIKTTDERNCPHNGSQGSGFDNSWVYKLIMKKPLGVSTLRRLKSLNTTCSRHLCRTKKCQEFVKRGHGRAEPQQGPVNGGISSSRQGSPTAVIRLCIHFWLNK